MLFAGILIALLTISASTRDVGRTTKASDEDLAEATYLGKIWKEDLGPIGNWFVDLALTGLCCIIKKTGIV